MLVQEAEEEIIGERSGAHVDPSTVDCSLIGSSRYSSTEDRIG